MKITVRNLTASILSTDVGAIAPGASKSMEMDPRQAYKASEGLKSMQDAGKCVVTVEGEANRLDSMEASIPAASVGATELDGTYPAGSVGATELDGTYPAGSVGPADLEETIYRYADVTITSEELLALNATPKTLVAAPGANKMIILDEIYLRTVMAAEPAAYVVDAGDDLTVKYTNGSGATAATVETDGFLTLTTAALRYCKASAAAAIAPVANAALVLHMATGEVLTGNSSLNVRVVYRVVPSTF